MTVTPGPLNQLAERQPAAQLQTMRDLLHSGLIARAIELGKELRDRIDDPSSLATLHLLMGRAELFNGRLAPAVQQFRMIDHGELSPKDRLLIGMWEAFSRYGAGGLDAVEDVVREVEANANGDALTLASLAGMRAWMSLERGSTSECVEQAIVANRMALEVGTTELISLSWLVLTLAHFMAAQTTLALKANGAGIEHAKQSGYGVALPLIHLVSCELDLIRGRLSHAKHHALQAIERSEPISGGLIGVWAHGLLSQIADRGGDDDAARDFLLSSERALLRGAPLGWGHLAVARLRLDRHEDPERAAQRLLDVWHHINDQGTSVHPNMFALSVASLATRLVHPATRSEFTKLLNELAPGNPPDYAANALARAVLSNDLDTAIEVAESLERCGDAFSMKAADAFVVVADLCEQHGDRRARSFAVAARDLYEKMAAHGDLRRLLHAHPYISKGTEPVLSAAERRVVALVLEGHNNASIATQLFLSVKTVESHLGRVYRRFGVKSRTQLASHLREAKR